MTKLINLINENYSPLNNNSNIHTITLTTFAVVKKQSFYGDYFIIFDKNLPAEENQAYFCFQSHLKRNFAELEKGWKWSELELTYKENKKGQNEVLDFFSADQEEDILVYDLDLKKPVEYLTPYQCQSVINGDKNLNPHICVKCCCPEKGYGIEWFWTRGAKSP